MTDQSDERAWFSPVSIENGETNSHTTPLELEKSFARTFAQVDGEKVLAHLRGLTRERFLGPEASDATLRYLEGQRGLVAYMERLAKRGRQQNQA